MPLVLGFRRKKGSRAISDAARQVARGAGDYSRALFSAKPFSVIWLWNPGGFEDGTVDDPKQ
jgi:hypothetical protein